MKITRTNISIIAILLCLTACKDDDSAKHFFSLSPDGITFPYEGGSETIFVTANGDWTIEDCPEWLTPTVNYLDKTFQELSLVADYYIGEEERTATIRFMQDGEPTLMQVTQGTHEHREFSLQRFSLTYMDTIQAINGGKDYRFTTKMGVNITPNMVSKAYVGNLIDGNIVRGSALKDYPQLHFRPATVSTSYSLESAVQFVPSWQAQNEYAQYIYGKHPQGSSLFQTDNVGISFSSHDQLNLFGRTHLDIALDELAGGGVSYKEREMTKKHGILFNFTHLRFSLDMDRENLVEEELTPDDFVGEHPIVVGGVSYGNLGLLIVESDYPPELLRQTYTVVARGGELNEQQQAAYSEMSACFVHFDNDWQIHADNGDGKVMQQYFDYLNTNKEDCYPVEMWWDSYFYVSRYVPMEIRLSR
jgi:hypothetical protein